LNDYDESVEKHIENKQLELSSKKKTLEKLESHLKNKEKAVDNTHKKVLELHGKLKSREQELNDLVAETVDRELSRRLKEDKAALRDEIKNTEKLNAELAKKTKTLEDTKAKLEKEYQKKIDAEQKKLNDMQSLYEKKLAQLTTEKTKLEADKKELEARRSDALKLINQAHEASREIDHINKLKAYIDKNKQKVETELTEDKELKNAILNAEKALIEEKKNLDNLIFSKYIENKLKNIKPETLSSSEDWRTELNSNPLYKQINQCKALLSQRKVNDAKSLYNQIRQAYENAQVSRKEKEALYVAIRELYNDIQLKIVESQMSK
ncbi:MAG TPA: hypothetical protein VEC16_02175, partial [Alphaproteobacteria bacterium]|nr:hypothetical protein [Alphaproteobacteria bacterium]